MRLSFQFEPKCSSLVTVNIRRSRNFMILHHSHEKYTNIFWVAGARLTSCLAVHQYKLYAYRFVIKSKKIIQTKCSSVISKYQKSWAFLSYQLKNLIQNDSFYLTNSIEQQQSTRFMVFFTKIVQIWMNLESCSISI